MDTMRGNFGSLAEANGYDQADEEFGHDTPPASIGQDERRMQVRAYNHWASLLEDRNFPSIEDLEPETLHDFGPYSVLLDFSSGVEDPGITFLGEKLALECDVGDDELNTLADVPSRSLLSRITDHYMQIIANQAPIGFEAEFVNQRGVTIAYRGILLPYSSDDDTIDFIYGVINWKELADAQASDELLLEIDQALQPRPAAVPGFEVGGPLTNWADGPGATPANDFTDRGVVAPIPSAYEPGTIDAAPDDGWDGGYDDLPVPSFGLDDEEEEEEEGDNEDGDDNEAPVRGPQFGSLLKMPLQLSPKPIELSDDDLAISYDARFGEPAADMTEPATPGAGGFEPFEPAGYESAFHEPQVDEPGAYGPAANEPEAYEPEAVARGL